ncbi:MAG: hypothetical protein ACI4ET_12605 [Bilifractor sp.]
MIKLDTAQMEDKEIKILYSTILEAAKAFYADPDNLSRYQEWLKTRQQSQEVKEWQNS